MAGFYLWHPCLHVCAWLSQVLVQGPLIVTGQVRLQESAWLAQPAKQASAAASATRKLNLLEIGPAVAAPVNMSNPTVKNSDFISNLPTSTRPKPSPIAYARLRRALVSSISALLIMNSSILWPVLSAAVSQRGCLPRPDQVSDGSSGFRYFG
jgi:hypothetical protein